MLEVLLKLGLSTPLLLLLAYMEGEERELEREVGWDCCWPLLVLERGGRPEEL